MTPPPSPLPSDDAEIRRLVAGAERMVREGVEEAGQGPQQAEEAAVRGGRVREWLRRRHGRPVVGHAADNSGQVTDTSCDASGEYTSSGESDGELESTDSEGLDCSVATCREVLPVTSREVGPVTSREVVPVTCHEVVLAANQLADSPESAPIQAALHCEPRQSRERPPTQLVLTPPGHVTDLSPGHVTDPAAPDTPTPTSSSGCSIVLTCPAQTRQPTNSGAADTPVWAGRRRVRARRPIISQSSGSEGSPTRRRRRAPRSPPTVDQDMADAGQADRRGSQVSCATDATLEDLSPSDVVTDDACDVISSVSEQAWDPYQEYKEISELGSEASVDPDALRRFLDTDDYRHFIDSLSDCTSSQVSSVPAAHRPPPRRLRRKLRAASDSLDSDTDGDEVPAALAESRHRLLLAQTELARRADQQDPICSGILTACRSELGRLEHLLTLIDPLGLSREPTSPYLKPAVVEIKSVIQQWVDLKTAAMELQQRADGLSRLQERIRSFRHGLVALDERTARAGRDVATIDDFEARISAIKALQQELADRRLELVDVNSDVHRYVTSGGQTSLKEDVATLYRIWEEVSHRAQAQLEHLSDAAATWREFEAERAALTAAMEADRRRLGLLQEALTTGGDVTKADVTGTDVTNTDVTDRPGNTTDVAGVLATDLSLSRLTSTGLDDLSEGTSGYDSACSDDLSERERRLGRLRRMAGDLETLLSPGGQAWSDITNTLTTATSGLRELQQSCRELVVKTTSQFQQEGGDGSSSARRQRGSPVLRRKSYSASRRDSAPLSPWSRGGRRGWARRVLRAALPFQLAMLLWLCAACLLEPGCCDDLNNLAMSLTPQLRYVSGPPPI